jgi:class 3 adenylate cyclase/tetratricopeptide (TPR) repeat protein
MGAFEITSPTARARATRCPACRAESLADSRFCTACGGTLAVICPSCDSDNPGGARFCHRCGRTLFSALEAGDPDPATVGESFLAYRGEGERRQLTLLFCDLVDSVRLGARLDPEELHEVIHAYQEACAGVVARHDGFIAQYSGDGLLVYFGYPVAHENDAQRAIQAALDIIEALAQLNTRLEPLRHFRLQARVGVHSGWVVAGQTRRGDAYETQVIGHAVNLAARLQGVADPGSAVISGATLHLARGLFVTQDLGPRHLKGIEEEVHVHRVVGPTGARGRLEAASGLTPFVGREHELALILDRWQQVRDGDGQVVFVTGEAGIGKSRLVDVVRQQLKGVPHRWLEAHCSPYHQHSAFHPVVELLEHELDRDRSAPDRSAALARALAHAGLSVADAGPFFAALLSLRQADGSAPPAGSAEARRRRTLELLVAWLVNLSAARPVVLVVEDLHWVDPSTQELLGVMLERSTAASILVLLTSRPIDEVPWPARSNVTHVMLHPLTQLQVGAMIERIAGERSLPADLCAQVAHKTDGIPLFVEELTKTVLESTLAREGTNGGTHPDRLAAVAIPSTLQDSLTARLDRLGPAKDVAQLGAVLGREFSYALLRAVGPADGAFVDHALRELVRSELLFQRGSPPEATYRFKHALVQEAAYRSLLRGHRQKAHARIADALGRLFPARVAAEPEEVARHYTEAGLAAEAIPYYRLAAERAMERSAHPEAVAHLTRALELCGDIRPATERHRTELALRVTLGPPLIAIRGYGDPEVEVVYERARVLCRDADDAHLFETAWGLANYYQARGELGTARTFGEQLVAIAERANEARLLVWAHLQLGATLFWQGEAAAALARLESAIALHEPSGRRLFPGSAEPGIAARSYAALALWQIGYPDRALRMSREAVTAGRACGDGFSLGLALCFTAMLHQLRREPAAVRELAEEVIALATAQEFPVWRGLGRVYLGWARAHAGEEAALDVEQGLTELATIGTEVGAPAGLALLADAKRATGRASEALGAVDAGLAMAEQRGQHTWDADLYRMKGEILVQLNAGANDAEAERCFVHALAAARDQKAFALRAATSLGRLLGHRGRRAEARAVLDGIYRRFTEGFDTVDLRDACALLRET